MMKNSKRAGSPQLQFMAKENIWKLLARKMAGEATQEELDELQDLLRNDPQMNYTAETFSRLWNGLPDHPKGPDGEKKFWNTVGENKSSLS
jgi:hypothetical protein